MTTRIRLKWTTGFSRATRRRVSPADICLAVVMALLPILPVWAEEGDETDYTDMSLEQLMAIPVTTASKREQKTTEAPSSVTVLTAQDIRAYGWRTLGDLLRSTPGFYVTYPRSYGFVGVRGFGRPGDFGGRVLLLLNGHRMNDPLYDTAAVMNDFILDMDLIDRVEIVRGPGSALYGNNAVFAVINVITKRAGEIGGVEASGEAGPYDTYRGRLTYGTRMTNGTEALVSGSRFRSDGNPHVHFPEYDSPETDNGIVHDGDGEKARQLYGNIRRGGLTVEAAYVGRNKDAPSPAYGTVFGMPRRTFDGRGLLEGRYEKPLTESMKLMTRLYYDWYEYEGNYPYDVAESDPPQELVRNRDESLAESVGGELQLNWQPGRQNAVTLGAEYRYDFRQMMKNFDVSPHADYLDIHPHSQITALYVQDEYRPRSNLTFTAGMRYDHYDTFGDTVNPRLACIYNPAPATTLKFLYGTAFRAPNANEFFYEDNGLTSKLNPNLKPEKISTYEIVCVQRFSARWQGSVAGFRNDVVDLIDQTQDPADGLYYSANLDKVIAQGVEFQLDGQLIQGIRGRASYTLTKTEDDATGEPLNNSPERLGKLNLMGPLFRGWLFGGGEVQYVSQRTTVGGQTLDGLWLFNTTLYTRNLRNAWDFSVGIYNLLNTHYHEPDASLDSIEQDGRAFRVKVAKHF